MTDLVKAEKVKSSTTLNMKSTSTTGDLSLKILLGSDEVIVKDDLLDKLSNIDMEMVVKMVVKYRKDLLLKKKRS
jgi:hypothetical protein